MSNTTPQPAMPSPRELVAETVDCFDVDKSKSSVLALDRPMLIDVGLILVDRERPDLDGYQHIIEELADEFAVSRSAYFRWASDFRHRFSAVRQTHRQRLAKLSIEHATQGRTDDTAQLLIAQMMRLAAERAVDADDLAQLEGKELSSIIAMIDGWSRGKHNQAKLDLTQQQHEQRAEKLQAEIEKLQIDNEQRRQQLVAAEREVKAKVEEQAKQGKSFTREDVIAMISKITKGDA